MEEKKCECKLNSKNWSYFLGNLIAYELAVIIIVLLFIHIDLEDLKDHKSINKKSSSEE
jgi:hypothetical protein